MKPYLTLLSVLGLAQVGLAADQRIQFLTYPSSYLAGSATQACIGQFTDDTVADAAMLVGGSLVLSYAPERHASFLRYPGPFSAMTKVTLGSSGREGLLLATNGGLSLATWNASTRQLVITAAYSNPTWASARKLEKICIGSAVEHICALSSSGSKLLTVDWSGSQIMSDSGRSIVLSGQALAVTAVNWDNDALPDFAYDFGTGLRIVSGTGASLYSYTNACTQPMLARLPVQGSKDDVAWITKNPGGPEQVLTVLRSATGQIDPAISTGSMVLASMTTAQMDANDSLDLVLARSDAPYAQVLYRQSSGIYSFGLFGDGDVVPGLSIDLTYVWSSGNVPVFASGDLDGDGDGDLYIAGQPSAVGNGQVWFGTAFAEEASNTKFVKPWVQWGEYVDWSYPEAPLPPATDTAHLWLQFWSGSISPLIASATDVRVTIWGRDTEAGIVRPTFLADTFVPRATTLADIPIPLPAIGNGLPQYLTLELSYVQRDPNGTVLRSFPSWTGQIDRVAGFHHMFFAGSTTTGGINRPPPPPTGGGSSTSP